MSLTPNDLSHPITPPDELVEQWWHDATGTTYQKIKYIATHAARWGADQELEACRQWTAQRTVQWSDGRWPADALRAARRPKPPSLKVRIAEAIAKGDKHQALHLLDEALSDD